MLQFSSSNEMNVKVAVLLGLIFAVQAKYEVSQKARDCMVQAKLDEQTVRSLVLAEITILEDNETMQQFFDCCYSDHITETNEVVVDDKLTTHVTKIFTDILGGKGEDVTELERDALEHCKVQTGDTKGKTAIRVVNCLKLKAFASKHTE